MAKYIFTWCLLFTLACAFPFNPDVQACCYENTPPGQATPIPDDGEEVEVPVTDDIPETAKQAEPEMSDERGNEDEEDILPLAFEETAFFKKIEQLSREDRHLDALRLLRVTQFTHREHSQIQNLIEEQRSRLGLTSRQSEFLTAPSAALSLSSLMPLTDKKATFDTRRITDSQRANIPDGQTQRYLEELGIILPLLNRDR